MKRPPEGPASPSLSGQLQSLQERLDEWIEDSRLRATELHGIVSGLRGWGPEPPAGADPSPGEARALDELAELAREVGALPDQAAVLGRLLTATSALAERAVLFIVRDGSLRGWSAAGLGPRVQARSLSFPLSDDMLLSRAVARCDVAHGAPPDPAVASLVAALGGVEPAEMAAAPLWVRDRVAAVLYADTRERAGWLAGSLAAAATLASLALEALPLRARHPRPASDPAAPSARTEAPAPPAASAPLSSTEAEDARRFAHLLVSEILLYNEAEIATGRQQKDLYPRLKDDIDRSRKMYDQRIPYNASGRDYFHEELVRELAGGDESALGMT